MEIVKLLCIITVQKIVCFFGGLVPKKRNRIVFGAWFGEKYDDNSKYLFEYVINNRTELDAKWITASRNVYNELANMNYPVLYSHNIKTYIYCLRAKYVITCTSSHDCGIVAFFPIFNKATFINLWHGIPLKKIMNDDKITTKPPQLKDKSIKTRLSNQIQNITKDITKGRYHIASSEYCKQIYISAFNTLPEKVLNLGQARNDYFYNNSNNSIRNKYNGKKIIVYMPTHRNEGKIMMDLHNQLDLERLNELCESNNAIFLIKKHFYHKNDPIIKDDEYKNIKEVTHEIIKSQELIAAADILITDYSSAYIDYLLLDRPIIFYAYDLDWYLSSDRELYLDYCQDNIPGRICTDQFELVSEIENVLVNKDSFADLRKKMRNLYYSQENQQLVSEKQIDTFISL